ncbi:sterile alpha motif domain-containing protein 14-like [Scleropages formosus]|uniref:Sterile alpha motif domain-containing protein 14-like n=1 Tax=Scleropages formosus TaxID=113540 RepID=A0A0P7VC19_SCLFO|nr:sterile alpha motif domain-containing protein 14-like [Scleropages formosus]
MSSPQPEEMENILDLNEAIPETELLDNSIQKGRTQLSIKSRRNRPSRSRLRDSFSSTEGDESLERRVCKITRLSVSCPQHFLKYAPISSSPGQKSPTFGFDAHLLRHSAEEETTATPAPSARYQQLTNASSQEALGSVRHSLPSKICLSSDSSPIYIRRPRRPDSEDDSHDSDRPEPGSSTVIMDKKTKRRFLDLGVTLRRSSGKVRKEKSNRLSMGNQELSEGLSWWSGSLFVPFSWFTDKGKASASLSQRTMPQNCSLQSSCQDSILSDKFCPRSPRASSRSESESKSSQPYQTLSQSPDELIDEPLHLVSAWSTQQVCEWLKGLNMEQYVPEFTAREVDGEQLLQMDSAKLKGLGVNSSTDRNALKRRLKDMHAAAEKERKALDKMDKLKRQLKREQEPQNS